MLGKTKSLPKPMPDSSFVFKVFAAVPSARGCVLNGTGDSGTTLSGKRPQRPAKEETIAARAVAT
jgi:hypothetical protein